MLTDKMTNFNQPSLDKIDRDLRCKNQMQKIFDQSNTAPETIPDMKVAMQSVRNNKTTFSQSFLSASGSRKVN